MNNLKDGPQLRSPGWNQETRAALENLIRQGAGKQLPVAFDFDNTLVCGDVGEATLAMLFRSGVLEPGRVAETLSPSFRLPGNGKVSLQPDTDPAGYYEAMLAPTAHGDRDPTPLANGYAWAVEIMDGLRPLDVVKATRAAFELSRTGTPAFIEATPGGASFPIPFFYPEMVELIAELLRNDFTVWIFSASNVWSVRWMVLRVLNPLLREHGVKRGMRAENVVGISTLLQDRKSYLYKDGLLVRERPDYAALDDQALREFRLTSRLQFPVPTYSGKVACILDQLGDRPYLSAGDSPGDHAMMRFSRHKLWIARLEKPNLQKLTLTTVRHTENNDWMVQPVLTRQTPGFVPDLAGLLRSHPKPSVGVLQSARLLMRSRCV